jgi:tRNA-binding protein
MMIEYSDFEKVEMRTGTIIKVEEFPQARKPAYKLLIDFGPAGIRKSSAQITVMYNANDLLGRQVIAVLNFPPKQIGNFISECLVLGAVQANGSVVLLQTERVTENGLLIS